MMAALNASSLYDRQRDGTTGAENASFPFSEPFLYKNDRFTKTGSGRQTQEKLRAKGFSAGNAIWNDACIAHTQGYYGDYYDNAAYAIPSGSGACERRPLFLGANLFNA